MFLFFFFEKREKKMKITHALNAEIDSKKEKKKMFKQDILMMRKTRIYI
jgi:hypothetical protein